MQKFSDSIQDGKGNAVAGASVQVNISGGAAATIYSDNGLTTTTNPLSTGSDGNFFFYAANGLYDLVITKTGLTFVAADTSKLTLFDPVDGGAAGAITNNQVVYKVSTGLKGSTGLTFDGTTLTLPDGSTWVAAGAAMATGKTFTPAQLAGIVGTTTNNSANAGSVGEVLESTVAAASAVALTTATSANVTSLSLTAGDWDVAAQVDHNAAATTSITLCQIGLSATSATLPTQAGGSGIDPDPLSIFRVAAQVPAGVFTTAVGPVRVSLAATTTIYLVVNDTFTVSTLSAYGTIRARRQR